MNSKILIAILCYLMMLLSSISAMALTGSSTIDKKYDEEIIKLWNQKKAGYSEMIKKSGENSDALYNIQIETNNLLRYAGYCQEYSLLDELCGLYLQALDTLTETDQYLYYYYPGSPRESVHPLDKKYRMWVNKQKPVGHETILNSAQFLYLLSDAVTIIVDIDKEKRTQRMQEALNKFIPLMIEHYNRWIFNVPGPFQVRGWGCSYDGQYVPTGMNHLEFLNKKMDKKLGNGKSPSYCNEVGDTDMWIIAGVANTLTIYREEKALVPITQDEYKKLLSYIQTAVRLLESRFSYTNLKDFDGKPVEGAIFDAGLHDDNTEYAFAGYSGQEYPEISPADKLKYRGKGVGWDLSHARRFVNVFESLLRSRDILGLDFPSKGLLEKMTNQFLYATFNRDFNKPLFTNFMDGTNGWFRVGYSNRTGFGYGPWDMSISVLTGGYGFWSKYNSDMKKVFAALTDMLKSDDPGIREHVIEHYETNYWSGYKRPHDIDFKNEENPYTQTVLIQFLPSLCLITDN